MSEFLKLLKGEFQRLVKYRIIFFGILVSVIWVLIIALTSKAEAESLIPLLVVTDTGMMSVVLLGASFFFEKQEGSIKTLLVTPVTVWQIIGAKVLSAIFTGILSTIMIVLSAWLIHGITVNLLGIFGATILSVFAHTAVGYILILYSREFMGFLMRYMGSVILFVVPLFLVPLGILEGDWQYLGMLSPMFATNVIVESLFKDVEPLRIIVAAVWLTALGGVLYPALIYNRFRENAIEG